MPRRTNPHRRRALQAIRTLARGADPRAELGRVMFLGRGQHRGAWSVEVTRSEGGRPPCTDTWVAQVPAHPGMADERRFRKESALLRGLQGLRRPFATPMPLGRIPVDDITVTVTRRCTGEPVSPSLPVARAAQVLGTAAAQVHALPTEGLVFPNTAHATARSDAQQGLAELLEIRSIAPALLDDVLAWAQAHLPPSHAPAVLTHGDLLEQNVLVSAQGPTALVDWEMAGLGDPAVDLAIIVRGRGRRRADQGPLRAALLTAYNRQAARPLSAEAVVLHELCMVADEVAWAREADHHAAMQANLAELEALWAGAQAGAVRA